MGTLRTLSGDQTCELEARTLVGRSPRCHLHLPNGRVSGEHAAVAWVRDGWEIRDLGSRNGTYVDGQRLTPGARQRITRGSRIAFGDQKALFELVDTRPPAASALAADGRASRAQDGVLALPDEDDPQLTVYWQAGQWWAEDDAGARPATDEVACAGTLWTLHLPQVLATTVQAAVHLSEVTLDLAVSRDEEYVETVAMLRNVPRALPFRAHHYLLAVLGRLRVANDDDGWVHTEDLTRMLALDRRTMNVQIFRARQEFGGLGIVDASALIQRRAGGLLRLGVDRVTVRQLHGT